ncbi:hypothetical protein ACWERV_03885 [Streptomyces sp. NPDC004031]
MKTWPRSQRSPSPISVCSGTCSRGPPGAGSRVLIPSSVPSEAM